MKHLCQLSIKIIRQYFLCLVHFCYYLEVKKPHYGNTLYLDYYSIFTQVDQAQSLVAPKISLYLTHK